MIFTIITSSPTPENRPQSPTGLQTLSYLYGMSPGFAEWNDTISALATPPGTGAIGVIRISGTRAIEIAGSLFPAKDLSRQPPNTLHVGYLKDGMDVLDEVVISLFRGPASYTGEDVIEIGCHGSPFIQQKILDALSQRGARLARPGEFTQRAFLNGKLDLVQAESVADLIASNTSASRHAALNSLRGGFSHILKDLREQLIRFSSLIELELDFSEEDVEFADRSRFLTLLEEMGRVVTNLLESFRLGNVIRNGVSVVIVGRPNAGKSTLLNTLLRDNRAIVSEIAGTTRDTVEEILNIRGVIFRLIDTAGIRDHVRDDIESLGMDRSRKKIGEAAIVLYLYDVNTTSDAEFAAFFGEISAINPAIVPVANKTDETNAEILAQKRKAFPGTIFISAKNDTGIDVLTDRLYHLATGDQPLTENAVLTNARHVAALQEVSKAILEIRAGIEKNIPGDLLSPDIRRCLYYLGEITGEITNDDQLDYIFSKFCIGK